VKLLLDAFMAEILKEAVLVCKYEEANWQQGLSLFCSEINIFGFSYMRIRQIFHRLNIVPKKLSN
jgi:hypothetical protein